MLSKFKVDNPGLLNQSMKMDAVRMQSILHPTPTPPTPSNSNNVEVVRLPPKVEFAIVSGLGILIFASPAIVEFICRKAQVVKTRLISLKDCINQAEFARKLAVLNRRRKVGSIIRVIGSILPNSMFRPPYRIYIPKWAQLSNNQWSFQVNNDIAALTPIKNPEFPSENEIEDGVIEAFEINSEYISSLSGAEDDDDDDEDAASSTPEGWTQEQRLANFNPTMNAT